VVGKRLFLLALFITSRPTPLKGGTVTSRKMKGEKMGTTGDWWNRSRHIPSECLWMSSPAISYLRLDQGVPSITCFLEVRSPSLSWVGQIPVRSTGSLPDTRCQGGLTDCLPSACCKRASPSHRLRDSVYFTLF